MIKGKLHRFPLTEIKGGEERRIEVKGVRPASLKYPETGDAVFLASYHRAQAAHDRLKASVTSKAAVEDVSQRIIEAKTGSRLDFVKVADVPDAWEALPRKRKLSALYVKNCRNVLCRFVDFMTEHYSDVEELAGVRSDHVRAFLDSEAARCISARTWNVSLKLLKTVFSKLEPNADAYRNFLRLESQKDEDTIHRAPFTDEETEAILEAAKNDDVLRGPLVVAICTAMRKGDCCLLKWSSVDLEQNYIMVCTSKTGETAEIPVMPLLREELMNTERAESEFVFQEAATIYQRSPQLLDGRFNRILAEAGFAGDESDRQSEAENEPAPVLPVLPEDELKERGLEAIRGASLTEGKRERMEQAFLAYLEGLSVNEVAKQLGVGKGTVSAHLNEIESWLGVAVVRRAAPRPQAVKVRGVKCTSSNGSGRIRRGSVRGWHSFRTGFITRALSSGMPEELVRRVTGHSAVDVVRKHYFRPGREDFRRAFEDFMPQLVKNTGKSPKEQVLDVLDGVTEQSWPQDIRKLRELIVQL